MRSSFLLLLALVLIPVMALRGQDAQTQENGTTPQAKTTVVQRLSLDDAIRITLQGHPALREAEDAVAAAEAEVKQARANYFPQLSFSGIAKAGLSGATGALGLPGFPASPF
jgi:outer membrane protein TolC